MLTKGIDKTRVFHLSSEAMASSDRAFTRQSQTAYTKVLRNFRQQARISGRSFCPLEPQQLPVDAWYRLEPPGDLVEQV